MPVPHHSVFTGRLPFLAPNQQRQSTEGTGCYTNNQDTEKKQQNERKETGVSGKTRSAAMLTSPGVDHFLSSDLRTFFVGCSTFCAHKSRTFDRPVVPTISEVHQSKLATTSVLEQKRRHCFFWCFLTGLTFLSYLGLGRSM